MITGAFDSGNIVDSPSAEVNVGISSRTDNPIIDLRIRPDTNSDPRFHYHQWFNFRFKGMSGEEYTLRILDADEAFVPKGWKEYEAVGSYDGENWFRLQTKYDGKNLIFSVKLTSPNIQIAYFVPYPYARHEKFIAALQAENEKKKDEKCIPCKQKKLEKV